MDRGRPIVGAYTRAEAGIKPTFFSGVIGERRTLRGEACARAWCSAPIREACRAWACRRALRAVAVSRAVMR